MSVLPRPLFILGGWCEGTAGSGRIECDGKTFETYIEYNKIYNQM